MSAFGTAAPVAAQPPTEVVVSARPAEGESAAPIGGGTIVLITGIAGLTMVGCLAALGRLRLEPKVTGWPVSPGEALGGFLALLFSGALGGTVAMQIAGVPPGDDTLRGESITGLGVFAMQLPVAVLAIVTLRRRGGRVGSRGAALLGAAIAALSWPIIQLASMAAAWVQVELGGLEPPAIGHQTLLELARGGGGAWGLGAIALAAIVAPAFEELAYRGMLQSAMRRLGARPWWAIVFTSLVFAAMHTGAFPPGAQAPGMAAVFTLSLALGWLFERTGSLTAPFVAHASFNSVNLLLLPLMV